MRTIEFLRSAGNRCRRHQNLTPMNAIRISVRIQGQPQMAGADLTAHLLLNVVGNREALRFTISLGVVRITRHEQDGVSDRGDDAIGDDVSLRGYFATVVDTAG